MIIFMLTSGPWTGRGSGVGSSPKGLGVGAPVLISPLPQVCPLASWTTSRLGVAATSHRSRSPPSSQLWVGRRDRVSGSQGADVRAEKLIRSWCGC